MVTSERYAIGTMDHSAAITRCAPRNPDWVYASGYINDLILIRKQMNDLGLKAPVITMIAGPGLCGVRQDRRPARREHHQHVVVASGGALQGQGRVRLDRSLQCRLGEEVQRRGRLHRGRPRPLRRHPANGDREGRHCRSGQGARRARGDSMPRPSTAASSSPPAVRSIPCSRRCSNWSAASRSCSGPTPSRRARSASCRSNCRHRALASSRRCIPPDLSSGTSTARRHDLSADRCEWPGARRAVRVHRGRLLAGLGRAQRHQHPARLVHRARLLRCVFRLRSSRHSSVHLDRHRRRRALCARLCAAGRHHQPRRHRAGADHADADLRPRSHPQQRDAGRVHRRLSRQSTLAQSARLARDRPGVPAGRPRRRDGARAAAHLVALPAVARQHASAAPSSRCAWTARPRR